MKNPIDKPHLGPSDMDGVNVHFMPPRQLLVNLDGEIFSGVFGPDGGEVKFLFDINSPVFWKTIESGLAKGAVKGWNDED